MKKIISILLAIVTSLAFIAAPVYASTSEEVCAKWRDELKKTGITDPNYASLCGETSTEKDAQERVATILGTVFLWAGIIAVIVVVIGGVLYVTSQGDPQKTARAKNTILFAVIGLIVAISAFAIVQFILSKV